jgi:riboflavin synthase
MGVSHENGSFFVFIELPKGWKMKLGDSVSVNGVCSTVRSVKNGKFEVEYMPETLDKTTAGAFKKGAIVNLEKSLKMSDLLDGHIVQGHVDCIGKVIGIKDVGESVVMKIGVPGKLIKFIAPKGSITVDGVSLTVVDTGKDWFSVSLVSYTLENTNLGVMKVGGMVNVETDVLAKYIVNYLNQ